MSNNNTLKQVIVIYMLDRLKRYSQKLREVQTDLQIKLETMDESKENLYYSREERIDSLDEIIEILDEVIDLIEQYNIQWRGIKTIK